MRFELKPYNRGLSDEVLLDDLREVARKLGKDFVTKEEYDKEGRLCSSTIQKRFGSWCKAHELAGLRKIRNYGATVKDCIDDLKRVGTKVGNTITTRDCKLHGQLCIPLIARLCGSFTVGVKRAGHTVSPLYHEKASEEELFENLERLWEGLGRQPKTDDFVKPHSCYSRNPYLRRFGSIRKALEAFVQSVDKPGKADAEPFDMEMSSAPATGEPIVRHRTSRTISWRMKFLVMRRDNFRCRITGRSPATDPHVILEVDHIVAWEKGGETVMENLQTLAKDINIGKSNLDMHEQANKPSEATR